MVVKRIVKIVKNYSYLLFGPRGVGKSTLMRSTFTSDFSILFNLLKQDVQERFLRNPDELADIVRALPENITHIIIDEVQKVPKLLEIGRAHV